jgi:formate dehydrogenase iron-sulfur subunit
MPTLYLPADSLARAVGADEVSTTLIMQAKERNLPLELQRTSSRGLYWLEPLLEVDTPERPYRFRSVDRCGCAVGA